MYTGHKEHSAPCGRGSRLSLLSPSPPNTRFTPRLRARSRASAFSLGEGIGFAPPPTHRQTGTSGSGVTKRPPLQGGELLPISPCPPPILSVPFASLMAVQAADLSRARMERRGKGRTHFTKTQEDALPLLGVPHPHPFSCEWGRGRGQTRRWERSRSRSAAAHKALHLLAFQAPPWASLFRGSRMPPSVVGGTVRLPLVALPPPSHLSLLLPAPRH